MDSQRPPHGIFESIGSSTLGWTQGLLISALVLLILLLVLWGLKAWRKKRLNKPQVVKNPWDELRSLIEAQGADTAPEHIGKLNHALRKALELKTGRAFTAWTSEEIMVELKRDEGFSSDFQSKCAQFLKTSDHVLYALQPLDNEDRSHWNQQISLWLESLQFGRPL